MRRFVFDGIGWYGVLAILPAYALVSFDAVTNKSALYQGLNLTGAVGLIIEASSKKDVQPAVLNIVWAVIALFALLSILLG